MSTQRLERKRIAVLFPGQGAQRRGICADLLKTAEARRLNLIARETIDIDILRTLAEAAEDELQKTAVAQPIMFFLGVLSYRLLREESHVYLVGAAGHSLGELAALQAAGVFSLEDGFYLVHQRSRFMEIACKKTLSGMLAVIGEEPLNLTALAESYGVYPANINADNQVVYAGELEKLQRFREEAKKLNYRTVFLRVEGAFHTPLMEEAASQFQLVLTKIKFHPPAFPVIANIDGAPYTLENVREKLYRQIASPVQWRRCLETLYKLKPEIWIETCPGSILLKMLPERFGGHRLALSNLQALRGITDA